MCGITGWIDYKTNIRDGNLDIYSKIITKMTDTLVPRGPDARGIWNSDHAILGHSRLAVVDIEGGKQPMTRNNNGHDFTITYNGELYNTEDVRRELETIGHQFSGHSDTEVLLTAYMEWGPSCVERLNGIFAFGIWDSRNQILFLARDRIGVKPLFFTVKPDSIIFASELKAMLAHPEIPAVIDGEGLCELFLIGPARTPGFGVFKNIQELKPGHCMIFKPTGPQVYPYWQLQFSDHPDNFEETVERARFLVTDAIERQLVTDVPLGTLLSGGLDSGIITAIAANKFKEKGAILQTFSIDYIDNDKYFRPSDFQPTPDNYWVEKMANEFNTKHHYFFLDTPELVDALNAAVCARDLPGMADIDSSLLLFSRMIKPHITVGLSGECADEVFGGYPWFYREDAYHAQTFPWAIYPETRLSAMSPELISKVEPYEYISSRYKSAIAEIDVDTKSMTHEEMGFRRISYLTLTRFMPTLLDRKDRMTMATGLEVRVPFCDHRIVEYLWNVPWEYKNYQNREKGLLRKAMEGLLPNDILWRKKSPYPKTHNPDFLKAVTQKMLNILNSSSAPILPLINRKTLKEAAIHSGYTSNKPWFGQLMDTPRLFAYLIQMDHWLREYNIEIQL